MEESSSSDPLSQAASASNVASSKKKASSSSSSSSLRWKRGADATPPPPTSIVCTARSSNNVELGLILSGLVFCVYLFGCLETMISLPDVPSSRSWSRHFGQNLNMARDEWFYNDHRHSEKSSSTLSRSLQYQHDFVHALPVEGNLTIPEGKWPTSILLDEGKFEIIPHPADKSRTMSVPKFWSPPIHQRKLMTRETAMKIGTCRSPDPITKSHVRGDACPLQERTIFIGIASYRDFQCRYTIESAFRMAKYPERIRVGVVDQIVAGEDPACNEPIKPCNVDPNQALCLYKGHVDVYQMEAQLSVGPVFARHIGNRLYRGEYYNTQSDAHVTFVKDWDVDIINQMESTKNEMAVLSTYLSDVVGAIDETTGKSLTHTRPIMCNTDYEGDFQTRYLRHGSQPERPPAIHGSPQLQPWWAAGYSFSRGHFLVNVPYDLLQPMIFQGEEMSIGIRGFTVGYDFYAPERSVCFHHYAEGKNAAIRNKVPHFWENSNRYQGVGVGAMARLLGIVRMNPEINPNKWDHTDESTYGLGGVRTPEKFYKLFGIDVVNKKVEKHLCRFVDIGGKMHLAFTPHLRRDGMGIDYNQIDFVFKDPGPPTEEE